MHEYIDDGDMFEYVLKHHSQLTERACKRLFAQIVKAVHFLHKNGVIHHDIKLENVGLRRGGTLVLMDFGYCCEYSNEILLSRFCGTLCYCAPELVSKPPLEYFWILLRLIFFTASGQTLCSYAS